MLPTRGLLHQHGENAWYHISSRGPTTKLRRVDREAPALIFRLPNDEERLLKILETSDVFSLGEIAVAASPYLEFPSRGFPHDERGKWLEVAELLIDVQPSRSASEVPENPVPITRLRRFYETLRLFPTMAVRSSILGYLTRDSDSADILGALFADSLAHLNSYRNVDEGFRPSSVRSWWPDYVDRHEAFARCLVARLSPERHPGPIRIAGSSPMEFAVVDYEVSPLRTPGGRKFDDGTAARRSGAGGVDLLCASRDGLPVIGEIKAPTDTSLFVALVQSLTYASELLTLQQVARLRRVYPSAFQTSGGQPTAELLLLVQADDRPRLEDDTLRLISALLGNPDGAVARHIRRVIVVSVELAPDSDPAFTLRHSIESARHAVNAFSRSPGSSSDEAR